MDKLLEEGVTILMLTSDYAEATERSDRIIVMRWGSICKESSSAASLTKRTFCGKRLVKSPPRKLS
jgi:ABC-type sugar transport system ATPase subunit